MKIINFKKNRMERLTKNRQKLYENEKVCSVCKESFKNKCLNDEGYGKVTGHCHYTGE